MVINPTSLDGSDEMLLLRQRAGAATPPPKPSDDYIQATTNPVPLPRGKGLGVRFLRTKLLVKLGGGLHQPRQHVCRSAAQTDIADRVISDS